MALPVGEFGKDKVNGVMKFHEYNQIMIAMVRVGVLGYGGGPSSIPLFRYEAVTKYHWVSDEEFAEILAFANALPGPVATKMAAYLGYQQKRTVGAILAIVMNILPSALSMVLLLAILSSLQDIGWIKGMINAVFPVVFVMLGLLAYDFVKKSWSGLGKIQGSLFGIIALGLLFLLHFNSGLVVILFLIYGAFHFRLSKWRMGKGGRYQK